jgi:hypothetical protein
MARWLVQLSGDPTDLEEFPRYFPDGDVSAVEENGAFFLLGPAFEVLPNAEAVLGEESRTLDRFTAAISLIWPALRKPTISHVVREADGGKRDAFVFLSGCISGRAKVGTVLASAGAPQQPPQRTQAQDLLRKAAGSPHLEVALSLWADLIRSWPRLYCVLEKIEQHLGQHVDAAGLCPANQRVRFRRTANTAEVAGSDARHATGKFPAPGNPMTLPEATDFIGQMLLASLR